MKVNNHNAMFDHVYQVDIYILGWIFILIAYKQGKCLTNKSHSNNITPAIPFKLY
jgi:hypothetical protein